MRYRKRIYLGKVDGVKKYRSVYGDTKEEAEYVASVVKRQLGKKEPPYWGGTVNDWMELFIVLKEDSLRPSTLRTIVSRFRALQKVYGDTEADAIKPFMLQDLVNKFAFPKEGEPLSRTTVKNFVVFLHAFFGFILENDGLEKNPALRLKIPNKLTDGKRLPLTSWEREVVEAYGHQMQLASMIMMYAGLRRGEFLALEWSDIDLKSKTINVTKTADSSDISIVQPPKNGKFRKVAIPEKLVAFLENYTPFPEGRVFDVLKTEERSSFPALWSNYMDGMCAEYSDMMPFTPHQLRHTFCTIMYEAGVDVLVAQKQMGHSSPAITMAVYTSISEEHKNANIIKLDEYLGSI